MLVAVGAKENTAVCADEQKDFASLQLLDTVSDDIGLHIQQIFDKFCSIIAERLQAHLGEATAYAAVLREQSTQEQECTVQLARFVKELGSLHRVLEQYLSPEQMDTVFGAVMARVEQAYADLLGQLDATDEALVGAAERDARKLGSTAEGLKHSPPVLTKVVGAAAQLRAKCEEHKKAQQEEKPAEVAIEDGEQGAAEEEEQHQPSSDDAQPQQESGEEGVAEAETRPDAEAEAKADG